LYQACCGARRCCSQSRYSTQSAGTPTGTASEGIYDSWPSPLRLARRTEQWRTFAKKRVVSFLLETIREGARSIQEETANSNTVSETAWLGWLIIKKRPSGSMQPVGLRDVWCDFSRGVGCDYGRDSSYQRCLRVSFGRYAYHAFSTPTNTIRPRHFESTS
jgi:hypothetical protein